MKKAISILLVFVLTLGLCACGSSQSNQIELTKENYTNYLTLRVGDRYNSQSVSVGYFGTQLRDTALFFSAESIAASTNFNYNDVVIKIRVYGTYGTATLASMTDTPEKTETFEIMMEIRPNISGNTAEIVYSDKILGGGYAIVDCTYKYEIVSISGNLTPA